MTTPKKDPESMQEELPTPTNVIAALARVMAEIGGIAKMTPVQRQRAGIGGGDTGISYAYRGIDQLAAAAQPLLGKYGVVIVPSVLDTTIEKIVKGNATMETTSWTRTTVEVEWSIYGPGTNHSNPVTDMIKSITVGVGDDNVDKGQNKAMTAAFKNLLLRILCIGDPADDSDGHGGNEDTAPPPDARPLGALLFEQIRDSDDVKLKALLKQFAADNHRSLTGKALIDDYDWAEKVNEAIEGYLARQEQDAAAGPQTEGGGVADAGEGKAAPPPEDTKVKLGSAATKKADAAKDVAAAVNEAFPGTTEIAP